MRDPRAQASRPPFRGRRHAGLHPRRRPRSLPGRRRGCRPAWRRPRNGGRDACARGSRMKPEYAWIAIVSLFWGGYPLVARGADLGGPLGALILSAVSLATI